MILNDEQVIVKQTIEEFLVNDLKELVIEGRAGTGKTTVLKFIEFDKNMTIGCALSHKAKNVLKEQLEGMQVVTVANLKGTEKVEDHFYGKVRFVNKGEEQILENFIFLVDEASMLSDDDRYRLKSLYPNSKFIYIGDPYQLPPIEDKNSNVFKLSNKATLIKNERTGGIILEYLNGIIECIENKNNIERLNKSYLSKDTIFTSDGRNLMFNKNIKEFYEKYGEFIFVTYHNKAKNEFNNYFRNQILNYSDPYVEGEKFIANEQFITQNNIRVLNNQILTINNYKEETTIISMPIKQGSDLNFEYKEIPVYEIKITFLGEGYDNQIKEYTDIIVNPIDNTFIESFKKTNDSLARTIYDKKIKSRLWVNYFQTMRLFADISPYYAISAHKSQGSTYPNVVVNAKDIFTSRMEPIEKLNCYYVACSRAKNNLNILL